MICLNKLFEPFAFFLAAALWCAVCGSNAWAQQQGRLAQQNSPELQRYMAQLDQLFANNDTDVLAKEMLGQSDGNLAAAALDWERPRWLEVPAFPFKSSMPEISGASGQLASS